MFQCIVRLFRASAHGRPFGPVWSVGDRVGCRVNFDDAIVVDDDDRQLSLVTFTKNGKEVG